MSDSKRKIRRYDDAFKQRATTLYHNSEKSYAELGKELGILSATLSTWVHNAKQANLKRRAKQTNNDECQVSREILQLKRAMSVLKEERDILKKALAIFSTDNPNQ